MDRNKARLDLIGHVSYGEVEHPLVRLPERMRHDGCTGRPVPAGMCVPASF